MSERRITGGSVFRAASGTDASMTPRPDQEVQNAIIGQMDIEQ
jgi:hypothetical protein